jgi:hypothetical protein
MNAAPKNPFILMIVVALMAGSWPVALMGGGTSDPQGVACAGDDACCKEEATCIEASHDDDCCPTGCNSCYLACCAGMVSLLPPPVMVASIEKTAPFDCQYPGDPSHPCEREIDHPPQS